MTRLNPQWLSSRRTRVAGVLAVAQLGYAHWFFGNLYEAVVRVPDRLASDFAPGADDRRLATVLGLEARCATTCPVSQ